MSTLELDHLIKMVNQIADNIACGDSESVAAEKVANHINRFWAPPMKDQLIRYANSDGARLNTVADQAAKQL